MTYCLVPGCDRPHNPDNNRICQSCGAQLLLKERYRAIQPLGRGGFGRTFLAVDEDIPSRPSCVIKQLCLSEPNPQAYCKAVELFHEEAMRLDQLGIHPQIPDLLGHFEHNRLLYLVQEYIEGQTLAEEVQSQGTFSELQVQQLLQDLLPVLQFIHDRNVIHRDIKPANIIRRQRDRSLVLIDFGIAKMLTSLSTIRTGTIVGSPEYMAPEQNRGKSLPASDLYSLGVVCLHLLTHRSPFDLFDLEQDRWNWRQFLPVGTRVSRHLGSILDQLLQAALSQRFQSANQVLQALQHSTLSVVGTQSQPVSIAPEASPDPSINLSAPLVSYRALRDLLAGGDWQAADSETWSLIRQLLNKPPQSYVFSSELARLSCDDLQTIDQFWQHYSQGRFGFTVQAILYCDEEKDYGRFCDRVGWSQDNRTDSPKNWRFKLSAPMGHLPSRIAIGGQQWWRHLAVLTEKLESCLGSPF
jgi:serine/threonine protein kinase